MREWYYIFIIIWFIIIFSLILWSTSRIKRDTFKEYIIPELEPRGLKFISSVNHKCDDPFEFYYNKSSTSGFPLIPNISFGGLASLGTSVFVGRKVTFKNEQGKLSESLATIVFDDLVFMKFKKIYWEPDLNNFSPNASDETPDSITYSIDEQDHIFYRIFFFVAIFFAAIIWLVS